MASLCTCRAAAHIRSAPRDPARTANLALPHPLLRLCVEVLATVGFASLSDAFCSARPTSPLLSSKGVRFIAAAPGEFFFTTVKVAGYTVRTPVPLRPTAAARSSATNDSLLSGLLSSVLLT